MLLVLLPQHSRAASTVYYVATSGADTNLGTLTAPLRSIQKAASRARAGGC